MILDEIIANKRHRVASLKSHFAAAALRQLARQLPASRDFLGALNKPGFNLIAEIKRASPSAGLIVKDFDPKTLAQKYEQGGAAAISILTDQKYFQGCLEYLTQVKAVSRLPLLRKDFIIDELQLSEARIAGADAVLLIVRILSDAELKNFLELASESGLAALVEVHSATEAERALKAGANFFGINNRDLDSLQIDLQLTVKLLKQFPELKQGVVISESGIKSRQDIELLQAAGANGALIGETLLKSQDIPAKIKELLG